MKKSILLLALLVALPIHGIENSTETKKKINVSNIELIGGIATAILIPFLGFAISKTHYDKRDYDYALASGKDIFNMVPQEAPGTTEVSPPPVLSDENRNTYFALSHTLRNRSYALHALLAGALVAFGFVAGRISHKFFKKKKTEEAVIPKTS